MSVVTIKFLKRVVYFLNLMPVAPWSALGSKEVNVGRASAMFCCVLGCFLAVGSRGFLFCRKHLVWLFSSPV